MDSIRSRDSIVHFEAKSYEALNIYLRETLPSSVFILTDSNTNQYCLPKLLSEMQAETIIEIIEIEPGEIHKTIDTCSGVWQTLAELGADRKSLMINLGGGVVTDLGGFVACTYKRGIPYINIPTTLLAMVDASVGGKTGVDLGNLKNMVGVISESEMVLVDTSYLDTLPANELRSGLAEMLKHGLIQDEAYWKKLSHLSHLTTDDLAQLIHDSVVIKNNIVFEDPTEQNVRKYLNFGHTLGHAIESYFLTHPTKITLLHGEAIAIGMIMEGYLSKTIGLSQEDYDEIKAVFSFWFPKVTISSDDIQPILDLLIFDKKNEGSTINFTLLHEIGSASYNCTVSDTVLREAIAYYQI